MRKTMYLAPSVVHMGATSLGESLPSRTTAGSKRKQRDFKPAQELAHHENPGCGFLRLVQTFRWHTLEYLSQPTIHGVRLHRPVLLRTALVAPTSDTFEERFLPNATLKRVMLGNSQATFQLQFNWDPHVAAEADYRYISQHPQISLSNIKEGQPAWVRHSPKGSFYAARG